METELTQELVKKAIALYEQAIKKEDRAFIWHNDLESGICYLFNHQFQINIYTDYYFKSFNPSGHVMWFDDYLTTGDISKSLVPRLEVLKMILKDMQEKEII